MCLLAERGASRKGDLLLREDLVLPLCELLPLSNLTETPPPNGPLSRAGDLCFFFFRFLPFRERRPREDRDLPLLLGVWDRDGPRACCPLSASGACPPDSLTFSERPFSGRELPPPGFAIEPTGVTATDVPSLPLVPDMLPFSWARCPFSSRSRLSLRGRPCTAGSFSTASRRSPSR